MAKQDRAFAAAMQIAAEDRPEHFTLKDGDYYFLDWRVPGWLCVGLADELFEINADDCHKSKPNHSTAPMTDKRALAEVEAAATVLDKHYRSGFLSACWCDQLEGVHYRCCMGRYEQKALDEREEAA